MTTVKNLEKQRRTQILADQDVERIRAEYGITKINLNEIRKEAQRLEKLVLNNDSSGNARRQKESIFKNAEANIKQAQQQVLEAQPTWMLTRLLGDVMGAFENSRGQVPSSNKGDEVVYQTKLSTKESSTEVSTPIPVRLTQSQRERKGRMQLIIVLAGAVGTCFIVTGLLTSLSNTP